MKKSVTTAALLALSALVGQPAAAQTAAVQTYNDEFAGIYAKLLPAIKQVADHEARAQLAGLGHQSSWVEVKVRGVRRVDLGIDTPPGFTQLTHDELALRVPRSGHWRLAVEAEVQVRVKLIWTWMTINLPPIELIVDELSLSVHARFDQTDPLRPVLSQIDRPAPSFKLRLRSPSWWFDILLRMLSPVGNWFAHKTVNDALDDLMPQLQAFSGQLPGPIPGDGTPLLVDSGRQVPFGEICRNVDRKIRRNHLPDGLMLMAKSDVPAHDSWDTAYLNGGPGSPGNHEVHGDGGDSAFFTGIWLASQSFRYAQTGESEAVDNVAWVLRGIGNLLDVNGTGLLARYAAPESSLMGQRLVRQGVYGRAVLHGVPYVGYQGGNGVSRDQILGVMFGLMVAHDNVPIPAVQAECSLRLQQMWDYLLAHDWYIDEDKPPVDFTNPANSSFPTFYFGIASQKLHYMLMGARLNPAKYSAELQRLSPLVYTHWLGAWTGVFDLQSYYKFNLAHLSYYNYFRLETDQTRWQEMARGFHITRRYVGHHMNPHFNLIEASVDPSLKPTYHSAAREALKKFVTRNHRKVAPPVVNTSQITYVTLPMPTFTIPGSNPRPATVTLPSEPVDITLRPPMGDFMWQRAPFSVARPNQGDPLIEKNGLDLVMPYWFGLHEGAF